MSVTGKTCSTCGREYTEERDFLTDTSQWRQCSMGNLWFNCSCGSTLMIRKGKFDWYSPEKTMSKEASSFFNEIAKTTELPHIPTAVINVQTMLKDPESDVRNIVKEVKTDPFIAAEILKVADGVKNLRNPAAPKIESLEHAISYMGRKALADLVLAISIKGFKTEVESFDMNLFWKNAFLRAAIAETLVTKFKIPIVADEAYLAGCLANIGKIISALCYPKETDKIYNTVQNLKTMTNWKNAERAHPKCNHQILGEVGAALWGLPEYIIQVCRFHHRTPKPGKKFNSRGNLIEVVSLANIMTHWMQLEPSQVDEKLLDALLPGFGLTRASFEKLVDDLMYIKKQVPDLAA